MAGWLLGAECWWLCDVRREHLRLQLTLRHRQVRAALPKGSLQLTLIAPEEGNTAVLLDGCDGYADMRGPVATIHATCTNIPDPSQSHDGMRSLSRGVDDDSCGRARARNQILVSMEARLVLQRSVRVNHVEKLDTFTNNPCSLSALATGHGKSWTRLLAPLSHTYSIASACTHACAHVSYEPETRWPYAWKLAHNCKVNLGCCRGPRPGA